MVKADKEPVIEFYTKFNKGVTSYKIFRPLDARAEIETFKNMLTLSLQTKMKLQGRAGACSDIEEVLEIVKMIQGCFVEKENQVNGAKKQYTYKDGSDKKAAPAEEKSTLSGEKKSLSSAPRPAPTGGKKKFIIPEWMKEYATELCPSSWMSLI